ncbi:hypothetical protein [Conexibacter arvalis]|uniref:Integral membrane protein n=1 Tax=Conexibacter arvalis TaxID=912552 RepID=A0A840IC09_9ACTN|nr:hypothetical protein [Conexibacter arvalis]MBB4662366.1 hypothetical protein [Conexibacter arvalis]
MSTSSASAHSVAPDDVRAAVAAGSELGRDYDDALAASLIERLDRQIEHQLDRRVPTLAQDAVTVLIALGSIGLGVVFVAAADPLGALGGTLATIVVWISIAVVNIAHARTRLRR